MADAGPVIFKRTKSRRTPRTREASPSRKDETNTPQELAEDSPSTLATKLKNKVKRSKAKSRLSFGGDEEKEGDGEVFQIKKSNLSHKLTLSKQAESLPSTLDQATISQRMNGGPTYDQAYLSELKASTPTTRPPLRDDEISAFDMSVDLDSSSIQIVETADISEQLETEIPSESSITNAKQKRERLRTKPFGQEDFISLTVTRRGDEPQGPHPESRLMREEDELGEGEDEYAEFTSAQERIALGKKARKDAAGKLRESMKELIADAAEEDDETMEWEQEQLRRGGHTAADFASKAPAKPVYKPTPIPPSTTIPTLGPAIARLTQSLSMLTTSHTNSTSSMVSLSEERGQLDAREVEMREMIAKAEAKRSWFAAFREWTESVANFLDEKYPQLEKLENEHVSLLTEKAAIVSKRRKSDDEDDLVVFLGSLPVQPDANDTGRSLPMANLVAARRDRRAARVLRRSRRQHTNAEEGHSTDSSLPSSDAADYRTAMAKLSSDAENVLSDVRAKEFKQPDLGLGKWFGEWRQRFGESYTGAWGGLGLVGAWEFWVRLELIGWNPFEDPRNLDSFDWYTSLYEYSRPSDSENEESELGPDGDLVSAMISTAIVPRVCKIIEGGGFDPYSTRDVRRVIDLAEQVEASVEKDNLKFQTLLKSVSVPFKDAATSTKTLAATYLSLNNPRFDPEAIPARQRFLARRMKLLQNLVRWRKYTGERFGIGMIYTELIESTVVPVARNGWEVGGEECITRIRSFTPQELIPPAMKSLA